MKTKRFNVYWVDKDDQTQNVNIIASTFTEVLECLSKIEEFILDNVIGVYVYYVTC